MKNSSKYSSSLSFTYKTIKNVIDFHLFWFVLIQFKSIEKSLHWAFKWAGGTNSLPRSFKFLDRRLISFRCIPVYYTYSTYSIVWYCERTSVFLYGKNSLFQKNIKECHSLCKWVFELKLEMHRIWFWNPSITNETLEFATFWTYNNHNYIFLNPAFGLSFIALCLKSM